MKNILSKTVLNLTSVLPDEQLQETLTQSFIEAHESVLKIENCFTLLSTHRWSKELLARFLNSWKATHLKMLAIYGLSCRLQRLALSTATPERENLLLASIYNAETSYEDLGLDYGGETHAELFDNFARLLLGNFPWQLEEYCLPAAREFRKWIYNNMVVDDISKGLLTNMFSEIYNHGEYTQALTAFSEFIDNHYNLSSEQKEKALHYINVHVTGETEVDHFFVVIKALKEYNQAANTPINYEQAKLLFKEYLNRLGIVMEDMTAMMEEEKHESKTFSYVS